MCFIPENFEYLENNWYTHVKIDSCCDIRKQFYLESVNEFRNNLKNLGLDLLISRLNFRDILQHTIKKDIHNIIIFGEDYYNEIWSLKEDLEKEI